jgi:MFS family permease
MDSGTPRETLGPVSLIGIAAGIFIFGHDFVAIGIVIPEIQDHFSSSLGSVQWAITGFSIAIALAVVPAGRLADIFGAGRTFVIGAFGFAAASALIAIAPEMWFLLGARTIEGVASGFLWISSIALVFHYFGPLRAGLAGAFLIGIGGFAEALAPIDAGLLIEGLGWRAAFVFNIPFCLFAGFVMLRHRSFGANPEADRSIDWTGIGLLASSLVSLLVTLRYASDWGWGSIPTIAGFLLAVAAMALFALQQRAWKFRALVPPDITANRIFVVTLIGELLLGGSFYTVLAFGPQIFTNVLGADSIEAGLMLSPAMLMFAIAGALTGPICVRFPPVVTVPTVGAVAAGGGLLLALMPDDPSYLSLLPGLLLVGAGSGAAFSALVTIGIASLPEERSGLAGGLLYTSQLAGAAIVLATATALATEVASGATDADFDGLVQGVKSGFLFGVGIAALGILATIIGYGARPSRSSPAEGTAEEPRGSDAAAAARTSG